MAKKSQRTADLAEEISDASVAPPSDAALQPSTSNFQLAAASAAQREFEKAVVSFFTDAAAPLGIPHSVAAIYGVVFASPVPLSFSEIAERLDLSKGSISQGLRALRDVGAVKEVEAPNRAAKGEEQRGKGPESRATGIGASLLPPGSLRDSSPLALGPSRAGAVARSATRYAPDTEMRKLIERFLESRVQPQLTSGKDRLAQLQQLSASFPPSHQAVLRQRVDKLQAWHDRTRGLIPLVRTFLKLT